MFHGYNHETFCLHLLSFILLYIMYIYLYIFTKAQKLGMYILYTYIFTKAQKLGIKNKVGIKDLATVVLTITVI